MERWCLCLLDYNLLFGQIKTRSRSYWNILWKISVLKKVIVDVERNRLVLSCFLINLLESLEIIKLKVKLNSFVGRSRNKIWYLFELFFELLHVLAFDYCQDYVLLERFRSCIQTLWEWEVRHFDKYFAHFKYLKYSLNQLFKGQLDFTFLTTPVSSNPSYLYVLKNLLHPFK